MRIVVGAMARSGSTWTFNAARLLAQEVFDPSKINAADNRLFKPMDGMDLEIIKTHATDGKQLPADKIVTCLRDMRDALCSAAKANIIEVSAFNRRGLTPGVFDGMRLLFEAPSYFWAKHAGYFVRYEYLHFNKMGVLLALGDYLFPGHEFSEEKLHEIAILLDLMPKIYGDAMDGEEEKGYLHGGRHIQGVGVMGHIEMLDLGDIVDIDREFESWFKYFQYPLHDEYGELEAKLYE
jgi:hypothetical protein